MFYRIDKRGYKRNIFSDQLRSREVAKKKLGRLGYKQVVHHIDRNKLNDHPSNLCVCSREIHSLIHKQNIREDNFWRRFYALKAKYSK
jgi:hypothetical protein